MADEKLSMEVFRVPVITPLLVILFYRSMDVYTDSHVHNLCVIEFSFYVIFEYQGQSSSLLN